MAIRVGVIGVGYLGRHHARIYSEMNSAQLYAVIDSDKAKAEEIARQYNSKAYTDYRSALDSLQALSIVTPTTSHYDIALECLKQGKDILIEKPIAHTVKKADMLIEEAEKRGLLLQVGHLERYNPAVVSASRFISEPLFFEAERVSPFSERAKDVDVTIDLMIHDIDIILSFLKYPNVKKLNASGGRIMTDKLDFASAWLEFQGGASAFIRASRVSEDTSRKLRIYEKDSYLLIDYQRQEIKKFLKTGKEISVEQTSLPPKEPLKEELRDFIDCVLKRTKPMVSAVEARNALQMAIKITNKIKTKDTTKI